MATLASPLFRYLVSRDFACLYSLSHPQLAAECALDAHRAALDMQRPDLAYEMNDLMGVIRTGHGTVVLSAEV